MRKTVWVLYRFIGWRGEWRYALVSKVRWQDVCAERKLLPKTQHARDQLEYITESDDKAMLEAMRDLTKE